MGKRLFIPGTGAAMFVASDNGEQVGSILDVARNKQHLLRCKHAADVDVLPPIETTSLKRPDGTPRQLEPRGFISAVYKVFADKRAPAYAFFEYDYRLDLRYNSGRLLDFLTGKRSNQKWDVVCHSQGGLLLMGASLLATQRGVDFAKLVRRAVFLGVPIQGTVNATAALVEGVDLFPGLNLLGTSVGKIRITPEVVRTWPSVYQMMPRWHVGVPGTTGAELFKASTWRNAELLSRDPKNGIHPDLLKRGRKWRIWMEAQAEPFKALCGIDELVIVSGKDHPTYARIPDFPKLPTSTRIDHETVVMGDKLVPMDLTFNRIPQALRDSIDGSFRMNGREHMLLGTELQKLDLCERVFES